MASAVEEPAKKRIRISYNDIPKTFVIARGDGDQDNVAHVARAFKVSSVGLEVLDNQSSSVSLTYNSLDAGQEYKILVATPPQAEADIFSVGSTSFSICK